VPVWQGSTLHQVRARHHIFATGAIEQPLVFAGNDLPGVMLSSGARRLIGLYSVKPGTRAVLATTSDRGLEAALALARLGISVAAVADLRAAPSALAPALQAAGIELLQGWTVTATRGRREVQGAVLAPLAGAAGHAGATAQAGTTARAGTKRPDKAFVCFCEDVTTKDIARAVAEGYESIELCKRFTTVTMGPCQGRMCQLSAVRLMAQETGQSLAQVGTTTSRPPWSTVPLGAFAGRPIEPAKRSSIHPRHRALGARIRWAGDWRRAYDYGDPEGEALAVHRSAGLIDVSTLGKLLVSGPDAGAFLDNLYPNRISTLNLGVCVTACSPPTPAGSWTTAP
jgi:sarcosine oxidase subunit alpha